MDTHISQRSHLIELCSGPLVNTLIPTEWTATEILSQPFHSTLTAFTENSELWLDDLLHTPIGICINDEICPRYFHGYVSDAIASGLNRNGLREFSLTLRPLFWFLSDTSDCRIFQNISIVDMSKQLLNEAKLTDIDFSGIHQTYPPKKFCVQYNESQFNFISRLLEEAGIFYYFKHDISTHTLMLCDDMSALPIYKGDVIYGQFKQDQKHLHHWQRTSTFFGNQIKMRDYNFQQPQSILTSESAAEMSPFLHLKSFMQYHYPGNFQDLASGKQLATQQLARQHWQSEQIEAQGNFPLFTPGLYFHLSSHEDRSECGDYYCVSVKHHAYDHTYLNKSDQNGQFSSNQVYENEFTCVPTALKFIPPPQHQKPKPYGFHSAIVSGPKGKEIYTDKYGRIKVHFPWDRRTQHDENSSCWIRVTQVNSGDLFGCHFLPRVGQEVTIEFIDGDIDKPLCTGALFNGEHLPPYALPAQQHQQGIKTRSIGSNHPEDGNEIRFDDSANAAHFYIQAQKDLDIVVKNNELMHIENQYQGIVQGDQTTLVKGDSVVEANQYIEFNAGQSCMRIEPNQIVIKSPNVDMGDVGGLPSHVLTNINEPLQPSWIETLSWHAGTPKPFISQPYRWFFSNDSLQSRSDNSGFGPLTHPQSKTINKITVNQAEIIQIENRVIQYPQDTVETQATDFESAQTSRQVFGQKMKTGDKFLKVYTLQAPIIINLRDDAKPAPNSTSANLNPYTRETLTSDEIDYLKNNGNHAVLFIHGFNVPFGCYSQQIDSLQDLNQHPIAHFSHSQRTLYHDNTMLAKRFPFLAQSPFALFDDVLNGTGAHNWFVHMEDNLNRATQQFYRDNYLKFTRLVNIAWTGDVKGDGFDNTINYLDNENTADKAGLKLVTLIKQLHQTGISIYIIAHSLGSRVLLKAMDYLGEQGATDIIEQAFLWQAAVPNTALSNNPESDTTMKHNAHYIHALPAAKRITVLFSQHDPVLTYAFWIANFIGIAPDKLFSSSNNLDPFVHATNPSSILLQPHADNWYTSMREKLDCYPEDWQVIKEYTEVLIGAVRVNLPVFMDDIKISAELTNKFLKLSREISNIIDRNKVTPALGHRGPDQSDLFIHKSINSGKIILADQSAWLTSHSGMKIPTPDLMTQVYQQFIINKQNGIKYFGRYN